jgi:hypothetical protein
VVDSLRFTAVIPSGFQFTLTLLQYPLFWQHFRRAGAYLQSVSKQAHLMSGRPSYFGKGQIGAKREQHSH